jgi:hypothetical protein
MVKQGKTNKPSSAQKVKLDSGLKKKRTLNEDAPTETKIKKKGFASNNIFIFASGSAPLHSFATFKKLK